MSYDIEAIRRKLAESRGKKADPDEFRPKKAENETPLKYRFFILPPFQQGEKIKGGPASKGMDQFFITHAQHWIQDRPHPCPRIYDGTECAICKEGYTQLAENKGDDEAVKRIYKEWMPNQYYMVNIYFPEWVKLNPDELKGKVKYYNAPKTCFDLFANCLIKEESSEEEPEAHGIFFDENAAFLFELQVTKKGRSNNYAQSKFLANNGVPQPMTKEGYPSVKEVLAQRLNLFDKVQKPDPKVIQKLAKALLHGDVAEQEEVSKESTTMRDKVEDAKKKTEIAEQKKKPAVVQDDEDDAPVTAPVVKKKQVTEDDDDAPVVKKKPAITSDDDDPPVSKKKPVIDDEDEAPVVRRKPVITDDEDDAPVAPKAAEKPAKKEQPKKVEEDDDDDIARLMKSLEDDE